MKPEFKWPKFQWHISIWFTLASFLISFVLLIFPELSQGKFDISRVFLVVIITLGIFILIAVFPWLYKSLQVIFGRVGIYQKLSETIGLQRQEITTMKNAMANLILNQVNARSFEILKASLSNGKLYIVLAKEAASKMSVGDIVEVIHSKDNMFMGEFKVIEIRKTEYYAEEKSNVDQLWLGYVRERGETQVMPYMRAVCISNGGQNGK